MTTQDEYRWEKGEEEGYYVLKLEDSLRVFFGSLPSEGKTGFSLVEVGPDGEHSRIFMSVSYDSSYNLLPFDVLYTSQYSPFKAEEKDTGGYDLFLENERKIAFAQGLPGASVLSDLYHLLDFTKEEIQRKRNGSGLKRAILGPVPALRNLAGRLLSTRVA